MRFDRKPKILSFDSVPLAEVVTLDPPFCLVVAILIVAVDFISGKQDIILLKFRSSNMIDLLILLVYTNKLS